MSEKIIGQVSTNEIDLEATIDSNGELNGNIETQNALNGTISYDLGLNGELSNEDTLEGSLGATTLNLKTNRHNDLVNRDLEDQHPINAITGLSKELMSIKESQNELNMSIKKLKENIDNKIRTTKSIPTDMQKGEYIFLIKEENNNGY